MSKYSNEFKLKVVQYSIEQKLGIESTALICGTIIVLAIIGQFGNNEDNK